MNERTRFSHSVWRSDILKSMGRSLFGSITSETLLAKRWAALSARPCRAARDLRGRSFGGGGLTFPALQTIVSYNCLKGNSPEGDQIWRPIIPALPFLPPP